MSFPKIPPQTHFLYDKKWNSGMDGLCLRTIVEQTKNNMWMPPYDPMPHAIACARAELNKWYGKDLTYDHVKDRVAFLKKRYDTFTEIVSLPESQWNPVLNEVYLHDPSWEKMFQKNGMSKAYFHKGEPEFRLLTQIFGPDDIKAESPHTIINISDGTVRINEPDHIVVEDSEDDEVTSPILRRRLFDDRQSENRSNDSRTFPQYHGLPPPAVDGEASYFTAGNSSCASSDPYNWGDYYFKP